MKKLKAGIITLSDKGSRGERIDESVEEIKALLPLIPAEFSCYELIPDEYSLIVKKLVEFTDKKGLDIVITTGGTGVSPRDVTPEATASVVDKIIPGMAEAMRFESLKKTPYAVISRGICGIKGKSLVINLPGSPKAARENLGVILPAIKHTVLKIQGDTSDCAAS